MLTFKEIHKQFGNTQKIVPILGAGHGGLDKQGNYVTAPSKMFKHPDGTVIYEGVTNRLIQQKLMKMLDQACIYYINITKGYEDIPLYKRTNQVNDIANFYGKNIVIYNSIHSNASVNKDAKGWQIHTYLGESLSDKHALVYFHEAHKEFTGRLAIRQESPDDPDWDSNFQVLRDTICPAVLTENFFMTNYEDCKFILSEQGQQRIARVHFNSLMKIIK